MRLDLFANGIIDDAAIEASAVRATRRGASALAVEIAGETTIAIDIRCSLRHPLQWAVIDPVDWVRFPASEEILLEAEHCSLHLEQMDRYAYWLGLSRGSECAAFSISSSAPVKARIRDRE